MREIVHIQAGQCGNQIGTKVSSAPASAQNFALCLKFTLSFRNT